MFELILVIALIIALYRILVYKIIILAAKQWLRDKGIEIGMEEAKEYISKAIEEPLE